MDWALWTHDVAARELGDVSPLLAQWEKKTNPAQIRLDAYCKDVAAQLGAVGGDVPLYLDVGIDVVDSRRLQKHHDLENYLTPLFGSRYLNPRIFSLVTAKKYVGGGSWIRFGTTKPSETQLRVTG